MKPPPEKLSVEEPEKPYSSSDGHDISDYKLDVPDNVQVKSIDAPEELFTPISVEEQERPHSSLDNDVISQVKFVDAWTQTDPEDFVYFLDSDEKLKAFTNVDSAVLNALEKYK